MYCIVHVEVEESTRFLEAKTGKDFRIRVFLFTVLGDRPGIINDRTVIFNNWNTALTGKRDLLFLSEAHWNSRKWNFFVCQHRFSAPTATATRQLPGNVKLATRGGYLTATWQLPENVKLATRAGYPTVTWQLPENVKLATRAGYPTATRQLPENVPASYMGV